MEHATFLDMIAKHLRYLLDDYAFSVAYQSKKVGFSDQFVAFASGRCGIGFTLDKGDVYMSVASADSADVWAYGLPDVWFDIALVISLLTPGMTGDELAHYYPVIDWALPDTDRIDRQLAELARKTRPYWDRVIELCKSGELNRNREALEQLEKRRGEVALREMMEKMAKRSPDDTTA